tara:strand:- start:408 stop:1082 length:675 start_codon:yes stop_codon:yes gene_type:complete
MIIGKAMINYQPYFENLDYFRRLLDCFRYINKKELGKTEEFIASFSNNQFQSKQWLMNKIDELNLISNKTKVSVLGCKFGSVLFPELLKRNVDMIYGYEMDKYAIPVSKMLFEKFDKVQFINQDIWIKKPRYIDETDMTINTSCEHMPPMKYWSYYKHGTYVFQSSNTDKFQFSGADKYDHINRVKNIDDFKSQMHPMLEILWSGEENIDYTVNGKRFMIIGIM